ncbi:MAG TPA: hypothetical protein VFI73_11500 [Candidatus Nitrosopolaris sp.]|nr:hypothetical protein [Candidatus Nitrosopolaris sp.]
MNAPEGVIGFPRMANKIPVKAKKHSMRSVSKQRHTGKTSWKKGKTKLHTRQRISALKPQFTENKNKKKNNKKIGAKSLTHTYRIKRNNAKSAKKTKTRRSFRIVRIMGHGQFTVNNKTLKELSKLDSSIVQLVSSDRPDDTEFKKMLTQLTKIVEMTGKPLSSKEIIQSDIILPSADLSIDEAKKLFKGEGVVPEI